MIDFKANGHLTLGVEIEVQLLDPQTFDLKPAAYTLFDHTGANPKIKPEIFQSMIEINTGICTNVHEARADLDETMSVLKQAASRADVRLAATGTHPFAKYSERKLFSAERYEQLIDRNQWIARRLMIYGLHVHLGMKDGDSCIRFNNFFLHFVPHLLALSASSPFWQGEETGLASSRSTIFESCPTAGHPCRLHSWEEFSDLCNNLTRCNAIGSHKDLWWDVRPSPDFGTLEIRICDGLATMGEALEMVAFIHALAHWYEAHSEFNSEIFAPYMWMMRENKWRAARHGLEADIITNANADVMPIRADVQEWLGLLHPQVKQLGYEAYFEGISHSLQKGTSGVRQRKVFAEKQTLAAVAQHNADEFESDMRRY
jgi:glutamate---cysteine ligase / carboxylate-amine ligase